MEDIFKSGLLGLALIGTLVIASVNINEEDKNGKNKGEELIVVDENKVSQEDRLTNKDNFHIPL